MPTSENDEETFWKRADARRRALGLSQTELIKLVGISQTAYQNYRTKGTTPHRDNLRRFAAALRCTVDDLDPPPAVPVVVMPTAPHAELGERLVLAREAVAGLSRETLAQLMGGGVTADDVAAWESGVRLPARAELARLNQILGLDSAKIGQDQSQGADVSNDELRRALGSELSADTRLRLASIAVSEGLTEDQVRALVGVLSRGRSAVSESRGLEPAPMRRGRPTSRGR